MTTEQPDEDDAELERPRRRLVPTRRRRDIFHGTDDYTDPIAVPAEDAAHWDARLWRDRPIR